VGPDQPGVPIGTVTSNCPSVTFNVCPVGRKIENRSAFRTLRVFSRKSTSDGGISRFMVLVENRRKLYVTARPQSFLRCGIIHIRCGPDARQISERILTKLT